MIVPPEAALSVNASRAMTGSSESAVPPVLVLAFNRPETTAHVIATLRKARPARVFFAVDGVRADRPRDRESVGQVRGLARLFDWGCEVHTLFRDENLGCKRAVSEAIDWFFEQNEAGIVLEDDCVADPSFFPFAAELLDRYRDDPRVALVSGNNFQFGRNRTDASYYFSRYNHIWGWASWRRAWRMYDHRMSRWPELRERGWLLDLLRDPVAAAYWTGIFDETHAERNSSWAYRWTFACWVNGALSVLPSGNLVSNIGFGGDSTHTFFRGRVAGMPTEPMRFPLRHPPAVVRNESADDATEKMLFSRARPVLTALKRVARFLGIRRGRGGDGR
jgi:hypothetical protein